MNHNTTLAVAMIVAAMAVSGIAAMATPAFAGGHHHNNGIKVNQNADQVNACSGPPPRTLETAANNTALSVHLITTLCDNEGSNSADIQH